MNVFTSLGIFIISTLIIISLKVIPSIFALFYHSASGRYSVRKVDDLVIFFIFGAETLPAIIFAILNLILSTFTFINLDFNSRIFFIVLASLFFALALAFLIFYFKKGRTSELFLSRKTAKSLLAKSKSIKTRSDAFILGFTAGLPELLFTLPLYFIVYLEITENFIATPACALLFLLFVLITVSPLFLLCIYFKIGNNLANFIRLRIKNKTFFRLFISLLYIILGAFLIIFRIYL